MIEVLLGCFGVSVAGSWAWNLALGRKVDAQTAAIMQAVTVVENMQESSQLDVEGVMDENNSHISFNSHCCERTTTVTSPSAAPA